MKQYLVIGKPIEHSLSPALHNYWIKSKNLEAIYGKLEAHESDLAEICKNLREGKINGLNVTIPYKKTIIQYLDVLSEHALKTQSVNTITINNGNLVGHNTDIDGFELSLEKINYNVCNKTALILGAGGVVPSIIYVLKKMKVGKILISNRTKKNAEYMKQFFDDVSIINWGDIPNFDIIINATSLGLRQGDKFGIDFNQKEKNKLFYDVIYNPHPTEFSRAGKIFGNKLENGLNMFLFQAQKAFNIWHKIEPAINDQLKEFLKINYEIKK